MSKITLKDIAKRLGTTSVTVSAALNGTGRVSDEKKAEILRVAEELGYHTAAAAQMLKRKSNPDIGLLINERSELINSSGMYVPMITEFLKLCEKLRVRNYIETSDPAKNDKTAPSSAASGMVGGMLITGMMGSKMENWFAEHPEFPKVYMEVPGEYSISTDFRGGAELALNYLAARGHRRIAVLTGPIIYPPHKEVEEAYQKLAGELNLENRTFQSFGRDTTKAAVSASYNYVSELLSRPDRPTAFYSSDMAIATGIIYAAMKKGLRVPEDISIIGSLPEYEGEHFLPAMSSYQMNHKEIVNSAVEMLRDLLNEKDISDKNLRIPMIFNELDSVTAVS